MSKPSKQLLEGLYFTENLSLREIGERFSKCEPTIRDWFISYGIPRRSKSEAVKIAYQTGRKPNPRGRDRVNWNENLRYKNSNGYVVVGVPKDYPYTRDTSRKQRIIYEHQLIWEQIHNKQLPKGWHIHHINGIFSDNRPSNLVALPAKQHYRILQIKSQKIRELEAENAQLRRALENSQMIFTIGEN